MFSNSVCCCCCFFSYSIKARRIHWRFNAFLLRKRNTYDLPWFMSGRLRFSPFQHNTQLLVLFFFFFFFIICSSSLDCLYVPTSRISTDTITQTDEWFRIKAEWLCTVANLCRYILAYNSDVVSFLLTLAAKYRRIFHSMAFIWTKLHCITLFQNVCV